MAEFLFELGVEEVPVSFINETMDQLLKGFEKHFEEKSIEYGKIESAKTNRRFMVYFDKISTYSGTKTEIVKGPSKKIAYDENNKPTKALEKFMEINGISESEIEEIDTKKGPYVSFTRKDEGEETFKILKEIIPSILNSMTFGKTMTWNNSGKQFVRPVRNLLSIFDGKRVNFEFAGISSSDSTFGHRLLSEEKIKISSFQEYCELLSKNFVIFSEIERKNKILTEIKEIEEELGFTVKFSEEMLNYFIYNNEYPVVFTGQFDKVYLNLPHEIISTFMINEKKLIPVYNSEGELTDTFAGVSNVPDESGFVSKGNMKVIKATFEDAKFFWDNDKKDDFEALRENLKNVVFQKDLGTFYDKSERIKDIAELISDMVGNSSQTKNIGEAALLCKNDLLTRMVGEFPSLQGIMGGLYLKEKGKSTDVWETVYHHYEPRGFVENELENLNAGILSLGDKLDNIIGLIARGTKVTSSKDPYGIRRDTSAIIKIIIDFKLNFDLGTVIDFAIARYSFKNIDKEKIIKTITSLFMGRMEYFLKDLLFLNGDIVNSVINNDSLFIFKIYLRAKTISELVKNSSSQHLIKLHKRIRNIIRNFDIFPVSETLLSEDAEKVLFDIFKESKAEIEELITKNKYIQACSNLIDMKPAVDNFFDKVLVMDKNDKVKENRIGLLQKLNDLLMKIADFSILTEAEK